jgi:hypothetical protein
MPMPPALRRAAFALHIVSSVGWIGAAAGYLVLGVVGSVSEQPLTIRAAWIGMELIGWLAVVPLGCLALLTGLVMSLGTPWGLVRHYWVLIALVLTVLALIVLILHMPTVTAAADIARTMGDRAATELGGDVLHPALGLVVLLVVAVLNVYKPRGLTPYGSRRARGRQSGPARPAAGR